MQSGISFSVKFLCFFGLLDLIVMLKFSKILVFFSAFHFCLFVRESGLCMLLTQPLSKNDLIIHFFRTGIIANSQNSS